MVGLRDLDADGKLDILWRHLTTGSNEIWFMNGTDLVPDRQAIMTVSVTWEVVGSGE